MKVKTKTLKHALVIPRGLRYHLKFSSFTLDSCHAKITVKDSLAERSCHGRRKLNHGGDGGVSYGYSPGKGKVNIYATSHRKQT